MPRHSIIIPHRKRNAHLACALHFLVESAKACRIRDFEIVVVDNRSSLLPGTEYDAVRLVADEQDGDLYNKPVALNLGIEAATGDVLTFLDADILVGRRWFEAARWLADPRITKVCYRVRDLRPSVSFSVDVTNPDWLKAVDHCWERYDDDRHRLRHEGRVLPQLDQPVGEPLFGNSQFSITRETLGDLRFCEAFAGSGWEDMWMNREIWRRYGEKYRAEMPVEPEMCLFHIKHPRMAEGWRSKETIQDNMARYVRT
jgi:glycosyltransferase involved in cell wall biosynthesis